MAVPKYNEMLNPLLKALQELGGSASIEEMEDKVAENLKLSDDDLNEIHRGNRTKFNYRLAWTRNYLKRYGILENSSRGVWSLTPKGLSSKVLDESDVIRAVKKIDNDYHAINAEPEISHDIKVSDWKTELIDILKKLTPDEFERLCQRVLREAGFVQVKVTGKSGDGGIDGTGTVKVGGFLSFRVIFQCKRYQGLVASSEIREFKGTMVGRADKGLFITTGTFSREAKLEASRDGSVPIDLIDGEELAEKMKELRLGVNVKTEEIAEVNEDWFSNF